MSTYGTKTLLGVKKQQKTQPSFFSSMFFRQLALSDTKEIAIDKVVPNLRLAPFVSPVVAGKVRRQDGYKTTSYAPPYVKPKDAVEPGNMLYRMAGEAEGGDMSPAQRRAATVAFLLEDQELAIQRREEKMCVDAIIDGKIVIEASDEHQAVEIDFGRSPENSITLVGAARWSQLDKSTTNMSKIIREYALISTGIPGVIIFDKSAFSTFIEFKGVLDLLNTTVANGNSALDLGPGLDDEVEYVGMFGKYKIYMHIGSYENDDGSKQMLMPENTMIMIPKNYGGVMAYGAIQDAKANASGIAKAKRWPKNWFSEDPSVEYVMTQTAPLPVLPDPDEIVVVNIGSDL